MTSIKLYAVKKISTTQYRRLESPSLYFASKHVGAEKYFYKVFQRSSRVYLWMLAVFFHSFSVQSLYLTTFRGRIFCLFGHIYGWLKHKRHQTRGMKQCCLHKTIRPLSIETTNRQLSKKTVLVTIHLTAIDKGWWRLCHCLGLPFSQCSRSHRLAFLEPEL